MQAVACQVYGACTVRASIPKEMQLADTESIAASRHALAVIRTSFAVQSRRAFGPDAQWCGKEPWKPHCTCSTQLKTIGHGRTLFAATYRFRGRSQRGKH